MTSKNDQVEDIYKKWEEKEHVLERSGMWVGSIEMDSQLLWVYNRTTNKMEYRKIDYIPGLYKIFDEIIVNARDQTVRDPSCKNINVVFNKESGEISVYNDGDNGIPVVIHKEHNIYIPEMIFGVLMTSSNHENNGKIVGGKNGLGSKLTNIFSKKFVVDIVDKKNKLEYSQEFYNNMYDKKDPVITKLNPKSKLNSSTKITFIPDYKRFGIDGLTDDILALFEKRVYDIAACTNVSVHLNGTLIEINNFSEYVSMFYESDDIIKNALVYQEFPRWKIGAIFDPTCGFKQISYVNGIYTANGGTHVNYIVSQIVSGISEKIKAKHKNMNVKNNYIKDNITIFIDATIEDPDFQSQIKEELSSKISSFGSTCIIPEQFIKSFAKTGIEEEVINFTRLKDESALKTSDGKKTRSIKIDKLEPARYAGTRQSYKCTLILCEGDSAKGTVLEGLENRDYYGVFPLRGKLLNVREATLKQLVENEEIKNIKKIMGLKQGKVYNDLSELNYGSILIMTDQDTDGIHIKGLIINFIHYWWPSLLKHNGFVKTLATPIIKTWKKTDKKQEKKLIFYTLTDYHNWKNTIDNIKLWNIKYYKGLGTHKDTEAAECFQDIDDKIINFIWDPKQQLNPQKNNNHDKEDIDEKSDSDVDHKSQDNNDKKEEIEELDEESIKNNSAILLGFAKNCIPKRKLWLENYDKNNILEFSQKNVTYYDFINKDLIHFSNYDTCRSIPSVKDGFKPSLRKILYGCFLQNLLNKELKVGQLSGYISADTAYHHGETSLQGTIVGMAHTFVGSNNINLLLPNGNFGNRRQGGKNAASARYIMTQLNNLTPLIFRKEDEPVYDYVDDDGFKVEPIAYAPIIPIILINGAHGIGTGFSTFVPNYNPKDVINNIKNKLLGKEFVKMTPWYKGFTGKIKKDNDVSYKTFGIYKILSDSSIHISELPVGVWTDDYHKFLDSITVIDKKKPQKNAIISSWYNDGGNNNISITVEFLPGVLQTLEKKNELVTKMKLSKAVAISNMHLYNNNDIIKKYTDINDIIEDYMKYRYDIYIKRKQYYLKFLKNQLDIIKWKVTFLEYVTKDKKIELFKESNSKRVPMKESDIINQLVKLNFPKLSNNINAEDDDKTYNYITNLKLWSLTEEEILLLTKEKLEKEAEYNIYNNTPVNNMWLAELEELEKEYDKWFIDQMGQSDSSKKNKSKRKTQKKK